MTESRSAHSTLPPLRELIAEHNLMAVKGLGQHYLLDENITRKIVRLAPNVSSRFILEIGPGPGGLSRSILEQSPTKLLAIEKDDRFAPVLAKISECYPNRFEVIFADALSVEERSIVPLSKDAIVIANLPYNISAPLLIKWLLADPWPAWFSDLVLMFQKEVADRILAGPGQKNYGRLSVMAQWRAEPRRLFNVAASAFVPPPKVESTVLHLVPRVEAKDPQLTRAIETVAKHAFGQRRKMLKSSLKSLGVEIPALLSTAEVSPTSRAEELSVEDYRRIAVGLLRMGSM